MSVPDSPFYFAQQQLFIDAALRNITMVNAAGDGGSGDEYANGLTNVEITHASPYSLVVGGASLSTVESAGAGQDPHQDIRQGDGRRPRHDLATGERRADGAAVERGVRGDAHRDGVEWLPRLPGDGAGGANVIADKSGKGGGYLTN